MNIRELPGALVVKIPDFHCHILSSIPGRGTETPQAMQCDQMCVCVCGAGGEGVAFLVVQLVKDTPAMQETLV